jgi:hypothetical protein
MALELMQAFRIFSREFSNSFIRFERFMLCKQLGSKDLMIKLKELTLLL